MAHLATQELVDAQTPPPLEGGCLDGFRFNVYVTTVDAALQQPLQEAWAAVVRDPQALLAALQEEVAAGGGAATELPCGLVATRKAGVAYPPVERMEPFQPKGLGLVGPSIVVGSDTAIAPIDHVVQGQTYTLYLQNYPAKSGVEVRLVDGADATTSGGVLLTTIASFEDDGLTELAWTVPAGQPEGRYYLRAGTAPPGGGVLFATSQPFSVVPAPLRRRWRYG